MCVLTTVHWSQGAEPFAVDVGTHAVNYPMSGTVHNHNKYIRVTDPIDFPRIKNSQKDTFKTYKIMNLNTFFFSCNMFVQ